MFNDVGVLHILVDFDVMPCPAGLYSLSSLIIRQTQTLTKPYQQSVCCAKAQNSKNKYAGQ